MVGQKRSLSKMVKEICLLKTKRKNGGNLKIKF